MNSDMIRDRLVAVLVETLAIDAGEISNATLLSDISDDSLEITEAVMEIEAAFKVEIPDDVAENLGTVGEIIAYLAAHEKEP